MPPDPPAAPERGHLKVFIGMAAGVGKTYRMLQEGRAESESGRDVAIGYLEPHGREETTAQAEGLEEIPPRMVDYRGTPLAEMDLPAVLERKPELCLIDELAHTNAPGIEHEKRYEDVQDVLAAGIDVYSTVNVQHLESLNDQIIQLTGTRVRETIPDEVLASADEVVLIDLTPEALIERLRAGKVYRQERVPAALNNFFKVENLAALRETALRHVAEGVEIKRLAPGARTPQPLRREEGFDEPSVPGAGTQAIAERLLALVALAPHSQRIVLGRTPRRAPRRARRAPTRPDPERGGPRAAGGVATSDSDARRAAARRRGRRRRGRGDRDGTPSCQHLRADGGAFSAHGPQAFPRAACDTALGGLAGRRRADRGRPHPARGFPEGHTSQRGHPEGRTLKGAGRQAGRRARDGRGRWRLTAGQVPGDRSRKIACAAQRLGA
jgi:hypothetical protein